MAKKYSGGGGRKGAGKGKTPRNSKPKSNRVKSGKAFVPDF